MKLILGLLLVLPALAMADTLTYLQRPLPPPARYTCASTGFSADGLTVLGVCQQSVPSNVRYAQPARYLFNTVWGLDGVLRQSTLFCKSPQHMGIDHSGCPSMVTYSDTNVTVLVDGSLFWLAAASVYGAEALNTQTDAFVWKP